LKKKKKKNKNKNSKAQAKLFIENLLLHVGERVAVVPRHRVQNVARRRRPWRRLAVSLDAVHQLGAAIPFQTTPLKKTPSFLKHITRNQLQRERIAVVLVHFFHEMESRAVNLHLLRALQQAKRIPGATVRWSEIRWNSRSKHTADGASR
jgi:hypothetical protein